MPYKSYEYKMRSSGPMSFDVGDMYTHTFMSEEREVITYEATSCFLTSQDMAGQFKENSNESGDYESASYSALQYTRHGPNGPIMAFQGKEVKKPGYKAEVNIGTGVPEFLNWEDLGG